MRRTGCRCPGCGASIKPPSRGRIAVRCPTCQIRFAVDAPTNEDPLGRRLDQACREIRVVQGSSKWLNLRQGLCMASETPDLLGMSLYKKTAEHVRDAKQGVQPFNNPAMRKGTEQEPYARAAYEKAHEKMRPAFFVSGDYGCSLDGINEDGSMIIEIKTPFKGRNSDRWRMAADGRITDHDYAQIQHQLMVCKADVAHLWVWDAHSGQAEALEVRPDEDFWARIRGAWDAFWPTLGKRR
jgi:putative phage-type endonuclease